MAKKVKKTVKLKESNERFCFHCGNVIDLDKDKWVIVGTHRGKIVMDESYFHFNCWVEHFNRAIVKRIQKGQDMALGMLSGAISKTLKIQKDN